MTTATLNTAFNITDFDRYYDDMVNLMASKLPNELFNQWFNEYGSYDSDGSEIEEMSFLLRHTDSVTYSICHLEALRMQQPIDNEPF